MIRLTFTMYLVWHDFGVVNKLIFIVENKREPFSIWKNSTRGYPAFIPDCRYIIREIALQLRLISRRGK